MDLEKVATLVKVARQSKEERRAAARARYRAGGAQLRRQNKIKQRMYRRQGGSAMKHRRKVQSQRLKHRPVRIRKDPLIKRRRDYS